MAHPDSPEMRNRVPNLTRTAYDDHSNTPSYLKYSQFESHDRKTGEVKKSERSYYNDSEEEDNFLNESVSSERKNKSTNPEEHNWKAYIIAVILFLISVGVIYLQFPRSSSELCIFRGLTHEGLKANFLNQPRDLSYIVDTILEKDRNSVDSLVLLHSPESFNTARCLANKLTETYAYNKRKECSITTIQPNDVNTGDDDFGEVLKKYIEKNGTAAVVQNLLGITPNKAQIFHTMCDDTIPTNIPSLLVFTLLSSSDPSNFPHREARNILSSAWKDLPDNVLDPLLARILGHVVNVSPETELPC